MSSQSFAPTRPLLKILYCLVPLDQKFERCTLVFRRCCGEVTAAHCNLGPMKKVFVGRKDRNYLISIHCTLDDYGFGLACLIGTSADGLSLVSGICSIHCTLLLEK